MNHLHALYTRLSHERIRHEANPTELSAVQVKQIEREIAGERAFLGLEVEETTISLDDDELLAELFA